jgi:hypothetical protein
VDFEGMIRELLETPAFKAAIAERFEGFAEHKHMPEQVRPNHRLTWDAAVESTAECFAGAIGEAMEKHPWLAKQAMKLMEA